MILTNIEIEVYDSIESDKIETPDDSEQSKLTKMIKLSLVPKMPEGVKFLIKDFPERCQPCAEVTSPRWTVHFASR